MWFRSSHPAELLPYPPRGVFRSTRPVLPAHPSGARRCALITGASSGIGYEMAHILADQEYNLVLVSRDRDRMLALAAELESRHGITVTSIARDLSTPHAPDELMMELRQRAIAPDMLINNAGFAQGGEFAAADASQILSLLHVNVVALTHLTRLILPGMISRQWGRVLNVASIAGFYPGPLTACYNASKAFVISFSQALSNECMGTGVTVTCLCPGPTKTRFAERAGLIGTKAFRNGVMSAADVADIGYAALMAGKPLVVAGVRNKLRMLPIPLVPSKILAHFSRKYHEV